MYRKEIMNFRVSKEEKELIRRKALSTFLLPSDYIRKCAVDKKIVIINGLDEFQVELRRIGNNINQLTKLCNDGAITCLELNNVKKELNKLWQSVSSCLQKVQ